MPVPGLRPGWHGPGVAKEKGVCGGALPPGSDPEPRSAPAVAKLTSAPRSPAPQSASSVHASLCCPGWRLTAGGARSTHSWSGPAIAEGPDAVPPEPVGGCFKSGVSALPHGRGGTPSRCSPTAPSCQGRLSPVLHRAAEDGDPFPSALGRLGARAAGATPGAPSRQNSSRDSDEPPLRPSPFRERARGLGVPVLRPLPLPVRAGQPASHSRQLPSAGWKEDPPGSRQSLHASAPCPELPLAGSPDQLARPAAPLTLSSSHHLLPRGGGGGGLEVKGCRTSPSVPHSQPPAFWKGVAQLPARSTDASWDRG